MGNIAYVKERFDVGLLRANGTTKVGLMLTKRNGIPVYSEFDRPFLADQFYTGTPNEEYQNPQQELSHTEQDWRGGIGLEWQDANDVGRCWQAVMDTRHRGMMINPLKPETITRPDTVTPPTVTNPGFESGTADWTRSGTTIVGSTAQYHSGSASLLIPGAGGWVSQAMVCNTAQQGKYMCLTFWCKASSADVVDVSLSDDAGTSTYSKTIANTAWTKASVMRQINAASTSITVKVTPTTVAGSAYIDDATLVAQTQAGVGAFAEFNSAIYMGMGNTLCKLAGTATSLSVVGVLPASITSLAPFTDSRLYIACGTADAYWYCSTADVLTESTAGTATYQYFCPVLGAVPYLWGNDSVNTIRSNPDPAGSAWSGTTTVAASYRAITGLLSFSNQLYILKEDRPYYMDSTGAIRILTNITSMLASSTGGKNSLEWQGKLYMPYGTQGLLEYDAGVFTWRNPGHFISNAVMFTGRVQALAADEEYLYALMNGKGTGFSTSIMLLAGREEVINGVTQWVWHCISAGGIVDAIVAFASSLGEKRLYFTGGTDYLYYYKLYTAYGDPTTDDNRNYMLGTPGCFYSSKIDFGFRNEVKAFTKLTVQLGHTYDADIYYSVYYSLDGGTLTSLGNVDGTATNRSETLYFPANTYGKYMSLWFRGITDTATTTPILLSYTLKGILYPTPVSLISCQVNVSNDIVLKDGSVDSGSQAEVIAALNEARAAQWPFTFYDINGNSRTVKLLPLSENTPRFVVVRAEEEREPERYYNLLLQEVALS